MTDSIFQDHKDKELAQVRAAKRRLVGKISDALKDLPTLENEELVQIKAQRIEKQAEADARSAYAAAAARGVNKAPAPSVSAPLRLPAATPEKPATTPKKNRKPRASWSDELDYIAEVYSQTTQAGARGLWRSLKTKAGSEPSPFVLGTGPDRDKLVVKSSRATLAFHTLETNMKTIREMAAEIAAQQK